MSISKVRLPNNTEEDIKAKYLIQSSLSDVTSAEFSARTVTEDAIANIQKIYGNTVKFNQLIQNGNFSSGTTGWSANRGSLSASNSILTYTVTNAGASCSMYRSDMSIVSGHKYLFSYFVTCSKATTVMAAIGSNTAETQRITASTKTHYTKVVASTAASQYAYCYFNRDTDLSNNDTVLVENVNLFDLTAIYGSGNEPTISEFEAQYPAEYYPYTLPTLLSNSATSIQSKDSNNNVIGNCDLNIPTLTGKLNGTGSSVVIFPNGMQLNGTTRDELTATSAIKRIADDNSVLSTPQTYILDNALQLQYPVVAGGTEMVLPTTGTAPMKMDVIYGNAADATSNLSSNFISVDSMKAFLNNLGTQMGGTWNMQYNNGKFEFTFSSS